MKAFKGYDEVQVNNGFGEKLKLGGHICKVLEAKIEPFTSKKDGKTYEQLVIKFDIEAPDEQAGFYANKFSEDAQKDALNAKWKGFHRISVPTDESEDFIKSNFKAFTTSIEESNTGYKWAWNEETLVGKVFGGVFSYEEFMTSDETIIPLTRIRYVKSIEGINEVATPKVRLIDKSLMNYEDYIEMKRKERQNNGNQGTTSTTTSSSGNIADSDELPF